MSTVNRIYRVTNSSRNPILIVATSPEHVIKLSIQLSHTRSKNGIKVIDDITEEYIKSHRHSIKELHGWHCGQLVRVCSGNYSYVSIRQPKGELL